MTTPQRRGAPQPPPNGAVLQQALAAFQQGRPADCAALCEQLLGSHRKNATALHLLGASKLQLGDAPGAVQTLSRAARLDARNAELHTNLGAALRAAVERAKAQATLKRALSLKPDHVPALFNLGNLATDAGDHAGAADCCRRVLSLAPGHPGALSNLGRALAATGDAAGSEDAYRAALTAAPGYADAACGLVRLYRETGRPKEALAASDAALASMPGDAGLHNEGGVALLTLDRPEDAIGAFRAALAINDTNADALINLGSALCMAGQSAEGAAVLEKALTAGANDPDTLSNLGATFIDIQLYQRADDVLQQALTGDAQHPDALHNLGRLRQKEGREDEAIALFDRALAARPHFTDALFSRATANLAAGRFSQGWADNLHRPSMAKAAHFHREVLPQDLTGRHVLVECDQGLGDEIFFLRFVPALRARGARVTYRPDPRLTAMLRRAGAADHVLDRDEQPAAHDLRVSVGDLPFLLGHGDNDALSPSIVLPPLEDRVAALRDRLQSLGPPPWTGLTWRAGTRGVRKALTKSTPEIELARILADAQARPVTWIALQRLPDPGEIDAVSAALGAPLHDLTALNADIEEMLALVSLLDGYICVSNTNVHLAAACGRTCRILAPHPAEFRWMSEAGPSPWFPDMPTYRKRPDGAWDDAYAQLAADLAAS